eukprot:64855-Amphidinium_carterae.1
MSHDVTLPTAEYTVYPTTEDIFSSQQLTMQGWPELGFHPCTPRAAACRPWSHTNHCDHAS